RSFFPVFVIASIYSGASRCQTVIAIGRIGKWRGGSVYIMTAIGAKRLFPIRTATTALDQAVVELWCTSIDIINIRPNGRRGTAIYNAVIYFWISVTIVHSIPKTLSCICD